MKSVVDSFMEINNGVETIRTIIGMDIKTVKIKAIMTTYIENGEEVKTLEEGKFFKST